METLHKTEERARGRRLDEVGTRRQRPRQWSQEATAGGGRRYRYMVVLRSYGQWLGLAMVYNVALGVCEYMGQ